MKKLLLTAALLLAIPLTIQAAPKRPILLFDNVSTIGATSTAYDARLYPDQASWELVENPDGPPTAYDVAIQGSIRCVNGVAEAGSFHDISEILNTTTVKFRSIALKPYRCFRAILNSKTGGGSFDVYLLPRN